MLLPMRAFTTLFALSLLAAAIDSALALAPCPETCHLAQGQPLLLVDTDTLLVTRCNRDTSQAGVESNCVTEQLALDGTVRRQLPRVPRVIDSDEDFKQRYLDGHTLVELSWQDPWRTHKKPYVLSELFTHQQLKLSLTKSTLTCTAPGLPTVTRDFGCVPSEVHVFATASYDKPPRRPVVVVGVCQSNPHTTYEVVVVCTAGESKK
jgi:hypothetical protein